MAIDLKNLSSDVATCTVRYQGMTSKVTYRPGYLTANNIGKLEAASSGDALAQFVVDLVVDWDIKNGKSKLPITLDAVGDLPFPLLRAITQAVTQDGDSDPEA